MKDDATIDALMQSFEDAAQGTSDGVEFWYARDLQHLFEYEQWRRFAEVIERAKVACEQGGQAVEDHFANVGKMVAIGSGATREIDDIAMSRYACYLAAQNADSSKRPVAFAQTYFTIQTRRQELADQAAPEVSYDERRVAFRNRLKMQQKSLAEAASFAGVETPDQFRRFMGAGLSGLYGGLSQAKLIARKNLKPGANHLDFAPEEELAANYFKATQAEAKLRREGETGVKRANDIHREAGEATRKAIQSLGGTMPEDLPVEEDIKKVERRLIAEAKAKETPIPKPSPKKITAKNKKEPVKKKTE